VARVAPKCANGECTKQGFHLCARCRGVTYCSAACQKVHWKQGSKVATSKNKKTAAQTSRGGYGRGERCGRRWIM
jgi:hypothetical protein